MVSPLYTEKMPPDPAAFRYLQLLALTLLVGNAAAGFAGRLAGSLAFAATAVLCAVAQIAGFDGSDMFHYSNLHKNSYYNYISSAKSKSICSVKEKKRLMVPACQQSFLPAAR